MYSESESEWPTHLLALICRPTYPRVLAVVTKPIHVSQEYAHESYQAGIETTSDKATCHEEKMIGGDS